MDIGNSKNYLGIICVYIQKDIANCFPELYMMVLVQYGRVGDLIGTGGEKSARDRFACKSLFSKLADCRCPMRAIALFISALKGADAMCANTALILPLF